MYIVRSLVSPAPYNSCSEDATVRHALARATLFPPHLLLLADHLNGLSNAISLARVDGLAGLLDLLEHGGVVEALVGLDGSGLGVEGDVEFFDTCGGEELLVRRL